MMELSHRSPPPSLWTAMLWKDYQQVKQTFASVAIGLFSIQLILVLVGFAAVLSDNKLTAFGGTIQLACVAPILMALGCSGMLIGQERQTGTWAWSSGLPVAWQHALASKLLVSILSSLVVLVPLSIIPVWLTLSGRLSVDYSSDGATFGFSVMIFFETLVACFLATMLIKETLTALVLAGFGLLLLQFCTWATLPVLRDFGFKFTGSDKLLYFYSSVFSFGIAMLLGGLLMALAFRWRWGLGQLATLFVMSNSSSLPVRSRMSYRFHAGKAPSEWSMMLQHSWANSFWLRLITFVGTLGLAIINPWEVTSFLLLASAFVFGISTFEGDQSLNRIRFLADRGAAPWKLALSRLGVAAMFPILLMVILMGSLIVFSNRQYLNGSIPVLMLVPVPFLTGALASMCVRKSIVATTLGIVVQVIAIATSALVLNWFGAVAEWTVETSDLLVNVVPYLTPFAFIAILVAIILLSHRWLVRDDAKLGPHFLWIAMASLLSPICLASTFGFLLIPNTPWQDVAIPSEKPGAFREDVLNFSHPLLNDYAELKNISVDPNGYDKVLSSVWSEALQIANQEPERNAMEIIVSLLEPLEQELKSGAKPAGVELQYQHYATSLSNMIARTAALACICLDQKDPESAVRFWRANRELQVLAHQFDPRMTNYSRSFAMQLLSSLSDEKVMAMGGNEVCKSLIPPAANERTEGIRRGWLVVNQYRTYLKTSGVGFFPPLRWRVERQLAYSVNRGSQQLKPEDFLTGSFRARLLNRFP